ncbi:hypothetical protein LSTR_LSTR015139 [Laodelphax striatellus]|uniref:RNA-binding protein 38 n=1 Tax=Laodelphax striatellus TaxID=195883 RepID=A0A482XJU6_LAOST|nr:hypothetical protein LSTR_LSTR015139 [Laodelphax striatellus]
MGDRPAAERACKDPNPIIDGRKANVNLAILGAKPRGTVQPGLMCPAHRTKRVEESEEDGGRRGGKSVEGGGMVGKSEAQGRQLSGAPVPVTVTSRYNTCCCCCPVQLFRFRTVAVAAAANTLVFQFSTDR